MYIFLDACLKYLKNAAPLWGEIVERRTGEHFADPTLSPLTLRGEENPPVVPPCLRGDGVSIDDIRDGIIGGWQNVLAREYGVDVG
jgi:hypothetical protein